MFHSRSEEAHDEMFIKKNQNTESMVNQQKVSEGVKVWND